MLVDKALLAITVPVHPKGVLMGLRSGLCAGQSSSSTPNSSNHVFRDLVCAMGHSHAGIEKRLPQFVPAKLEALSEISCYADALRFLFTGIKGTSLTLEKQPPYHYPLLHQTWKFS